MATFIQSRSSRKGVVLTANVTKVRAGLTRFMREMGNREPTNRRLALLFTTWVQRNFATGGTLQTPVWAPLEESTRREKERKGYSPLPLTRTGELRGSFYPVFDKNTAGVRSDSPIAKYHQDGTKHMKRRALLPPEKYVREQTVNAYGLLMENSLKRSGLK